MKLTSKNTDNIEYIGNNIMKKTTKICSNPKCGSELPATLEFFHKDKNQTSGLCCRCKKCVLEASKKFYYKNKNKIIKRQIKYAKSEKSKSIQKEYRQSKKYKEIQRKYRKKYFKSNRGKKVRRKYQQSDKGKRASRRGVKKYFQSDKGKATYKKYEQSLKGKKMHRRKARKHYQNNKLSYNMSSGIYQSLKNNKNYTHWKTFVSYTIEELALYLQGTVGLTTKIYLVEFWKHFYGEYYHVDHIIPRSFFDKEKLQDPNSEEFQKCWSLENLQLLFWLNNLQKNDSLDWT